MKGPKNVYKRKPWYKRTESIIKEWENLRQGIWKILKSKETLDVFCNVCLEQNAIIKCKDCIHSSLCHICDDIVHSSFPLHDRIIDGRRLTPLESYDNKEEITMKGSYVIFIVT